MLILCIFISYGHVLDLGISGSSSILYHWSSRRNFYSLLLAVIVSLLVAWVKCISRYSLVLFLYYGISS